MGSFSLAHFQIVIFISIFAFVILILFNKKPERKKILFAGLAVSFLLAFLSSYSRSSVSEEQALKILCDSARGEAIGACVGMQPGAVGMGRCQSAVDKAASICKRPDLTIMKILEEAAKESPK